MLSGAEGKLRRDQVEPGTGGFQTNVQDRVRVGIGDLQFDAGPPGFRRNLPEIELDAVEQGVVHSGLSSEGFPARFAVPVAGGYAFAFVPQLLAASNANLQFGVPSVKKEFCRDNGKSALVDFGRDFGDLPLVQQKLARAPRLHVIPVAHFVRGDIEVVDPHFAVLHATEAVLKVGESQSDGLYLCSGQGEAGDVGVDNLVFVPGFTILNCDGANGGVRLLYCWHSDTLYRRDTRVRFFRILERGPPPNPSTS